MDEVSQIQHEQSRVEISIPRWIEFIWANKWLNFAYRLCFYERQAFITGVAVSEWLQMGWAEEWAKFVRGLWRRFRSKFMKKVMQRRRERIFYLVCVKWLRLSWQRMAVRHALFILGLAGWRVIPPRSIQHTSAGARPGAVEEAG